MLSLLCFSPITLSYVTAEQQPWGVEPHKADHSYCYHTLILASALLLVSTTDGWWNCDCDKSPWSWMLSVSQGFHQRHNPKIYWREEICGESKASLSFPPHILSSTFPLHLSSSQSSSSLSAAVSLDAHGLSVHKKANDIPSFWPLARQNPLILHSCTFFKHRFSADE